MSDLIDLICCPNCQSDLKSLGSQNVGEKKDEIQYFECGDCKAKFRGKNNILILISKELEEELRS